MQYNFGRPLCQGANIDRVKEECLFCIAIQMGQLTILMMEKIEIHEEFVTKRFYIFCNCNCVSSLNKFINKCFVCKKRAETGFLGSHFFQLWSWGQYFVKEVKRSESLWICVCLDVSHGEPVCEEEGVGPKAEHEDDDDQLLGGDRGLGHTPHPWRWEQGDGCTRRDHQGGVGPRWLL